MSPEQSELLVQGFESAQLPEEQMEPLGQSKSLTHVLDGLHAPSTVQKSPGEQSESLWHKVLSVEALTVPAVNVPLSV